jgi:hypothetical protein
MQSVEVKVKIGLMWFDDDPHRELEQKVLRAATHYERKYGQRPDLCFVHPGALNGNGKRSVKKAGGVEIRAGRSVLPYHFWLGLAEDAPETGARASTRAATPQDGG